MLKKYFLLCFLFDKYTIFVVIICFCLMLVSDGVCSQMVRCFAEWVTEDRVGFAGCVSEMANGKTKLAVVG